MKMKSLLILALILPIFSTMLAQDEKLDEKQNKKMNVAVVEFDVKGDLNIPDAGAIIADWMSDGMVKTGKYKMTERVLLNKVLQEQKLQISGILNESSAVELGRIYGVQAIISGSVSEVDNQIYITARLIDTENGEIIYSSSASTTNFNKVRSLIIKYMAKELAGEKVDYKLDEDIIEEGEQKINEDIYYKYKDKTYKEPNKEPTDTLIVDRQYQVPPLITEKPIWKPPKLLTLPKINLLFTLGFIKVDNYLSSSLELELKIVNGLYLTPFVYLISYYYDDVYDLEILSSGLYLRFMLNLMPSLLAMHISLGPSYYIVPEDFDYGIDANLGLRFYMMPAIFLEARGWAHLWLGMFYALLPEGGLAIGIEF